MELRRFDDATDFYKRAQDFLLRREAEHNLLHCFLFTDLGNPTSNHIYQDIGYRPVCDVDEYKFT